MRIQAVGGESIELVRLYSKQTYLGVMAGKTLLVNEILLEDVKLNFVPEEWHRYPHVLVGETVPLDQEETKLPEVTCSALIVVDGGASNAKEIPLVVIWFQGSFFEQPPTGVMEEIKSLDWEQYSGNAPYFS